MGQVSRRLVVMAMLAYLVFPSCSVTALVAQKQAERKKATVTKAVPVIELSKIEQLKEAFQRDVGKVRFVTILSPT